LIAAGALWLFLETARLREQLEQARVESEAAEEAARNKQRQLESEIARANSQIEERARQLDQAQRERDQTKKQLDQLSNRREPLDPILSFVIYPGSLRESDQAEKLVINRRASIVHLRLGLREGDNYALFRAELRDERGNLLLVTDRLRPRRTRIGNAVTVAIAASQLLDSNYEITLKGERASGGLDVVDFYTFTVIRR
jgi:hypothetical protein